MSGHTFRIGCWLAALGLAAGLSGCTNSTVTSVRQSTDLEAVWRDRDFDFEDARRAVLPADQVFALDAETDSQLQAVTLRFSEPGKRFAYLMETVFGEKLDAFPYQGAQTTPAAVTLRNRGGNCISLAIMTVALADRLGLDAQIQEVRTAGIWERRGKLNFLNRHINVLIRRPTSLAIGGLDFSRDAVIDFEPGRTPSLRGATTVSRDRVLAMFYTNQAAERMVVNDLRGAYANLRAAAAQDPSFDATWINLARLYQSQQRFEPAELALSHALQLNPDSYSALLSMQLLLRRTGRYEQALAYEQRLAERRNRDPFFLYERGIEAAGQGDWATAEAHFKRAEGLVSGFRDLHMALLSVYQQRADQAGIAEELAKLEELNRSEAQLAVYKRKQASR